ncbi:MAG: von Willebrand factor type A domain-containing protein [Planctomycetaceae bacterium]
MTRDHDHDRAADMRRRLAALEGDGLDGAAPTPEELELVRASAHALGQLEGAEAEAMERRLAGAASAAERALVAESIEIAAALRAGVAPPPGPVGVPSVRTAVAAALAGARQAPVAPAPAARKGAGAAVRTRMPLAVLGSLASAALVLVALPVLWPSRDEAPAQPSKAAGPAAPATALTDAPAAAATPAPTDAIVMGDAPAGSGAAMAPMAAAKETAERVVEEQPAAEAVAVVKSLDLSGRGDPVAARSGPPTSIPSDALVAGGGDHPAPDGAPAGERGPVALPFDGAAAADGQLAQVPLQSKLHANLEDEEARPGPDRVAGKRLDVAGGGGGGRPLMAVGEPAGAPAPGSKARMMARGALPGPPGMMGGSPPAGAMGMGMMPEAPAPEVAERLEARDDGRWFHERDRLSIERGRAVAGERYAQFVENPFRSADESPLSTFAIDVDTASYTVVRRFINDRQRPPADAVRLEEMLNYFRYDDPAPADGDPLAVRLESAACPWQPRHRLLRVALKGREIAAAARPGTSLVFLVDVSGSMGEPDKLPLVKQALGMLVDELSENDRVAIVTYAGEAGVKLPPTSGDQKARIRAAIDALSAGGSTNGSAGIEVAYRLAQEAFVKGGSNRVLLATDGDLNVGITDDAALVGLIKEKAGSGVFLTVLGFGRGNLQDEKMEKLADNGNGLYAYLDSAREARKVLVEQLTGSTVTIAKDVKIQIEFNPARVESYRLLGYENRLLAARDFADDTKDAGEVGAGHGVTALYEIVPVAGTTPQAAPDRPLKYRRRPAQPEAAQADDSPELCTVSLRWKAPEAGESLLREIPFEDAGGSFEAASADLRFAAAVAEFGMLLRSSRHRGEASLEHVAATASGALGADRGGLRAEFLDLVREAGALLPHEGRPVPN